jgi:NAD(P)-dependent dehydrogenase (short-subunit alcohol dehydrogenase family)
MGGHRETHAHQVPLLGRGQGGVAEEGRPDAVSPQQPPAGGEHGHRSVAEPGEHALHSGRDVVAELTTQYARALPGIRVNAADPGYTATDLNGHSGPQTVAEGTEAIVMLATEGADAGTSRFVDRFVPVR